MDFSGLTELSNFRSSFQHQIRGFSEHDFPKDLGADLGGDTDCTHSFSPPLFEASTSDFTPSRPSVTKVTTGLPSRPVRRSVGHQRRRIASDGTYRDTQPVTATRSGASMPALRGMFRDAALVPPAALSPISSGQTRMIRMRSADLNSISRSMETVSRRSSLNFRSPMSTIGENADTSPPPLSCSFNSGSSSFAQFDDIGPMYQMESFPDFSSSNTTPHGVSPTGATGGFRRQELQSVHEGRLRKSEASRSRMNAYVRTFIVVSQDGAEILRRDGRVKPSSFDSSSDEEIDFFDLLGDNFCRISISAEMRVFQLLEKVKDEKHLLVKDRAISSFTLETFTGRFPLGLSKIIADVPTSERILTLMSETNDAPHVTVGRKYGENCMRPHLSLFNFTDASASEPSHFVCRVAIALQRGARCKYRRCHVTINADSVHHSADWKADTRGLRNTDDEHESEDSEDFESALAEPASLDNFEFKVNGAAKSDWGRSRRPYHPENSSEAGSEAETVDSGSDHQEPVWGCAGSSDPGIATYSGYPPPTPPKRPTPWRASILLAGMGSAGPSLVKAYSRGDHDISAAADMCAACGGVCMKKRNSLSSVYGNSLPYPKDRQRTCSCTTTVSSRRNRSANLGSVTGEVKDAESPALSRSSQFLNTVKAIGERISRSRPRVSFGSFGSGDGNISATSAGEEFSSPSSPSNSDIYALTSPSRRKSVVTTHDRIKPRLSSSGFTVASMVDRKMQSIHLPLNLPISSISNITFHKIKQCLFRITYEILPSNSAKYPLFKAGGAARILTASPSSHALDIQTRRFKQQRSAFPDTDHITLIYRTNHPKECAEMASKLEYLLKETPTSSL